MICEQCDNRARVRVLTKYAEHQPVVRHYCLSCADELHRSVGERPSLRASFHGSSKLGLLVTGQLGLLATGGLTHFISGSSSGSFSNFVCNAAIVMSAGLTLPILSVWSRQWDTINEPTLNRAEFQG
jgi:hypothetical protein